MKMKITRFGHAIMEGDTHISAWVESHGAIDHGQDIEHTFRQWIKEGDTVVDAGAFIGDHTVPYAQIVGPTGKVLAFEPNPAVFACLEHNTQCYSWVENHNWGLSDQRNNTPDLLLADNLGASYLVSPGKVLPLAARILPVKCTNLDSYGLKKCAFIKIDVEGWEIPMLRGAKETLQRCRPIIRIEVIEGNQQRQGRSANSIFVWFAKNLKDYVLDPRTHNGQPSYDMMAVPRERLTKWDQQDT